MPPAAARLVDDFHTQHERLYTFAERETQVEIVTLRLRAIGLVDKIALPEIAVAAARSPRRTSSGLSGSTARRITFPPTGATRCALATGSAAPRWSISSNSTSLVFPGQTAEVDRHGNLIIRLG